MQSAEIKPLATATDKTTDSNTRLSRSFSVEYYLNIASISSTEYLFVIVTMM